MTRARWDAALGDYWDAHDAVSYTHLDVYKRQAPIKALVSEKFFALCAIFGHESVGMVTGDASVNPDAPIVCCTCLLYTSRCV